MSFSVNSISAKGAIGAGSVAVTGSVIRAVFGEVVVAVVTAEVSAEVAVTFAVTFAAISAEVSAEVALVGLALSTAGEQAAKSKPAKIIGKIFFIIKIPRIVIINHAGGQSPLR
jgi:hypothetical protein